MRAARVPLTRLMRSVAEKLLERFYEGPVAPSRLAEQVATFAVLNPRATREEWAEFSARLAAGAYRDGFSRGFDWQVRNIDQIPPDAPERVSEEAANNFPWEAPGHMTSDQLAERVEGEFYETLPTDEAKAAHLDAIGRYQGGFRLVVIPQGKRLPDPPAGRGEGER